MDRGMDNGADEVTNRRAICSLFSRRWQSAAGAQHEFREVLGS
jgi:hypothetical protein